LNTTGNAVLNDSNPFVLGTNTLDKTLQFSNGGTITITGSGSSTFNNQVSGELLLILAKKIHECGQPLSIQILSTLLLGLRGFNSHRNSTRSIIDVLTEKISFNRTSFKQDSFCLAIRGMER
ncbi:MAG: hypothetical protein ACK55I_15395, partial [bacterium]